MASDSLNTDKLISNLGGCGTFQVLLLTLTAFVRIMASMSMIMMAFGSYNPGWKCIGLGDATTKDGANVSKIESNDTDQCQAYKDCTNIQFASGVSTVVTEWQLICDKAWISSLIISLQMLGVLLGSFISGYLGDKIGRKRTLFFTLFYHIIVNVIAIFSNSWYMFAVMRFLIGLCLPILVYMPVVLLVEFVPCKWRAAAWILPTFSTGCTISALLAMTIRDWKYMHAIVAVFSFIDLFPVYWMPDSLRWFIVKEKMENAVTTVRSMARLNGKKINERQAVKELTNVYSSQSQAKDFTFIQLLLQLLRKGVRYPAIVSGILCLSMSLIYYAISFGVKSMPGDFYTNLIIISCADIPVLPISATLPNYIGRKLTIIIFLCICTTSLFVIVGLDLRAEGGLKTIGITVCVIAIRMLIEPAWDVVLVYIGEIFPTVMRSTCIAYTSWFARIGGILAPYLIPDNEETRYIYFLTLGLLALLCCVLVIFLRETKGEPLKDVWYDSVTNSVHENEC